MVSDMTHVYLDPAQKLVDAVADWMLTRARHTPGGAITLAHLLVVVPTAQAGRRLRLALATRVAGGLVPPVVKMPAQLLVPEVPERPPEADAVTELAVLATLLKTVGPTDYAALYPHGATRHGAFGEAVDAAQALLRVWSILGENGLLMRDVADRVGDLLRGENLDCEVARWQDLARLEAAYLQALAARDLRFRGESAALAVAHPPALSGVEEIVLPALLSPLPAFYKVLAACSKPVTVLIHAMEADAGDFDDWGRVRPDAACLADLGVATARVAVFATPDAEATRVADWFAHVAPTDALPALTLADRELFPEMRGAFQARALQVHNPARENVATSSLGHLLGQLVALASAPRYDVFSAFVRQGDVQRWLAAALKLDRLALVKALAALDALKTQHLPETLSDVARVATGDLARVVAFVQERLALCADLAPVRALLVEIFGARALDERNAEDREFASAAEAVRDMFDEFDALDLHLSPDDLRTLFAKRLAGATYTLEPDSGDTLQTDGWLEVPWLAEDELVIAGFQEGCVPESVVGHPFLPDALREKLGLVTNDQRMARDAFILREALACRPPENVRLSFHALAADGTALKPSRLLFRMRDDQALAARVKRFYADAGGTGETPPRTLPESWKLDLPIPPNEAPLAKISPTQLDDYLKCPLTYLLKTQFGESVDDAMNELDARHFGTLCHGALEKWGTGPLADSTDAEAIASALDAAVDEILVAWFGPEPPVIVVLQAQAARQRLRAFASLQAARRREGWKIVACECDLHVVYDETRLNGRCDRIDVNEHTGEWQVVDYKTWKDADKASPFDTSKVGVAFAHERGLPCTTLIDEKGTSKEAAWRSVQLPLYCAMLEVEAKKSGSPFAAAATALRTACYCVLGETAASTCFTTPFDTVGYQADAENLVRQLLADIRHGIFWPPSPEKAWKFAYAGLIFNTPEESVSEAWLNDQKTRVAGAKEADDGI